MPTNFTYTILGEWFSADADRERVPLGLLKPHHLLLLLSDGSLTVELELLMGARVEVDFICRRRDVLDDRAAGYLDRKPGSVALEREVWLRVGEKKLVYAHSFIPILRMEDGLLNDLESASSEPIGRVLGSRRIFFSKDRLEVGMVRCASAARGLGMDDQALLVARRYILTDGQDPAQSVIRASVTEVFSPDAIPCPAIQG